VIRNGDNIDFDNQYNVDLLLKYADNSLHIATSEVAEMPRPKAIPWDKRVSVFLAYRREGRKVYPVANRYGIARSTVSVIVKEFEDMGFEDGPRARLSVDLLLELQESHLHKVSANRHIELNLAPETLGGLAGQAMASNPVKVQEELAWHLKGTQIEQDLRDAEAAVRDFWSRESDADDQLSQAIEQVCGLPEWDDSTIHDPAPHVLTALKRKLCGAFIIGSFQEHPPSSNWLEWDVPPENPSHLKLRGTYVAIGDADDHLRVKQGVAEFLASGFQQHQRRFLQIHRLHRDLALTEEVLNRKLESFDESDIRRGICPACPYPEARPEPDMGTERTNRRAKEE
jgi:hypothetical protein